MTFIDDLIGGLGELRRHAESRMRGSCVIDRPDVDPEPNEDGVIESTFSEVYSGKCYTRYPGLAFETNSESAGATITTSRIIVRIPFGPVCRPGDRVTITADPDNPQLVGTRLRVGSIDDQSQATAQRLVCDDYQAGVQ